MSETREQLAKRLISEVIQEDVIRKDEREKILKELCFGDTFCVRWLKGDSEASWLQLKKHFTELDQR